MKQVSKELPAVKAVNVRFEPLPGLMEGLEKIRKAIPIQDRLNRSAFIRKILMEYVERHGEKEGASK